MQIEEGMAFSAMTCCLTHSLPSTYSFAMTTFSIRSARSGDERDVQRALRREGAHHGRGQRGTAPGERPDGGELRGGEGSHERPRNRALLTTSTSSP